MWRYTLTSLRAAKGRLLLTAVAIALGVGAVSGTFVIIDSASAAADEAFAEATPRVDVVVRATSHGEGEIFSDITGELFAQPMPATAVDRVARALGRLVTRSAGHVGHDRGRHRLCRSAFQLGIGHRHGGDPAGQSGVVDLVLEVAESRRRVVHRTVPFA